MGIAGPLPGCGPADKGGSGADVLGGGGISSGPGTDRLRASFIAGGWRYCLSSSVTPENKDTVGYKLTLIYWADRNLSMTIGITNRFLTHHYCMLTVAWLKMSLVVAKTWSVLHHTHWRLLLIGLLQVSKHIMKWEQKRIWKEGKSKDRKGNIYSDIIKSNWRWLFSWYWFDIQYNTI